MKLYMIGNSDTTDTVVITNSEPVVAEARLDPKSQVAELEFDGPSATIMRFTRADTDDQVSLQVLHRTGLDEAGFVEMSRARREALEKETQ